MSQIDFNIRIRNSHQSSVSVFLEPWGEVYTLAPNRTLVVKASGPISDSPDKMLEVEHAPDSITVYGWSGSGLTIQQ